MKIKVGKSKVLVVKNDRRESCVRVRMSGEEMQELDKFSYLGVAWGRKCSYATEGKKDMVDDGKVVRGEHDIYRRKKGVV